MSVSGFLSKLEAAADIGDYRGDGARKRKLADLVKTANRLSHGFAAAPFPEVASAILAVRGLTDVSANLDSTVQRLKSAPKGTLEAVDAQKQMDRIRGNLDVMIPALEITLATLEKLVKDAVAAERALAQIQEEMTTLQNTVEQDRARLASAAQAVENAVKVA